MTEPNPPIVLTLCESDRMALLEAALEFVLNRADGLNYVIDGVPILGDPKVDGARRLLPGVKWSWVRPKT